MFSLANKKLGDDIEAKSCSNLELVARPMFCTYAAILFRIASNAGYTASSLPLPVVSRVYIDWVRLVRFFCEYC